MTTELMKPSRQNKGVTRVGSGDLLGSIVKQQKLRADGMPPVPVLRRRHAMRFTAGFVSAGELEGIVATMPTPVGRRCNPQFPRPTFFLRTGAKFMNLSMLPNEKS